jgi:hypothetical protein
MSRTLQCSRYSECCGCSTHAEVHVGAAQLVAPAAAARVLGVDVAHRRHLQHRQAAVWLMYSVSGRGALRLIRALVYSGRAHLQAVAAPLVGGDVAKGACRLVKIHACIGRSYTIQGWQVSFRVHKMMSEMMSINLETGQVHAYHRCCMLLCCVRSSTRPRLLH